MVRVGRRQVLVADVCASADGHGVGYGIMLKRIEKVLRFGSATGTAVFYPYEAAAINTAVFRLRSEDVEIVPQRGWLAAWLRCVWLAGAPFRAGAPRLWPQRAIAHLILRSLYARVERSRRVPQAIRRLIVRPRPIYKKLQAAHAAYAGLAAKRWQRTFKQHASAKLRAAEREGRELPLRLSLPPEGEREAVARAAELGIPPAARLVTVHVRESGYRSAAGLRQRPLDLLRNAHVADYFDAFAALAARGYTVVRLGDTTMTPVARAGVVDLATSALRTEWLETWCIRHSEFLIGCDSGPSWLAFLLGVPVLTVNAIHFRDITRPRDRFICKRARERDTGRTLAIAEMLTEAYLRDGLDAARYEHLDNTPADIAEAVLDMIEVVRGAEELSPVQRRFNQRLSALGRELPHEWSGLRGVAFVREPRGTISRRFAGRYY
jgi:putative glycosyltransferase (TIGR04372 family)